MTMDEKKPNPVDVHVGNRVRLRRTLIGMSQDKLGKALSLTFQQVQKYERGANRIGASRLYQISQILDVPITFFYDDMPAEVTGEPSTNMSATGQLKDVKRKDLEFMKDFVELEWPEKQAVHAIVKTINKAKSNDN